jgi:predicted Zn-dependent protease
MSAGQLQQVIGAGVSVATSGQSEQTQQIWNQAYGVGTSRGDVTFSRNHETEADQIGLTLMAIAGIIQKKQLLSGLEWQQILTEKLHLSFLVHIRQMHRDC